MRFLKSSNLECILKIRDIEAEAFGYPFGLDTAFPTLYRSAIIKRNNEYYIAFDEDFAAAVDVSNADVYNDDVVIVDEEESMDGDECY